MKCSEILKKFEEDFPLDAAEEWDNPGLLTGRPDSEIRTVYVTLDATDEAVEEAIRVGADLIISHHPLIFSPVRRVTDEDRVGRRLLAMAEHHIAYLAAHTNFDVRKMADLNEKQLGLKDTEVLMVTGERGGKPEGIGRVGALAGERTLSAFCGDVKRGLGIPYVLCYGDPDRVIRRAAVSGGSGKSVIEDAKRKHADVIVTGDIDYHTAIDSVADGLSVIDAGHYGTEYCFIDYMAGYFRKNFPELSVQKAEVRHPYIVY
jgi:dinuclear metal center YbgI/SA1388 family protein